MRLDPQLPWDELLHRCMQSWRDTARQRAKWHRGAEPCDRCTYDPYLKCADADEWPHWKRHSLADLMIELRNVLIDEYLDTQFCGDSLRSQLWGAHFVSVGAMTASRIEALRLVDDFVAFVDIWIRDQLSNLGDWPHRVRA